MAQKTITKAVARPEKTTSFRVNKITLNQHDLLSCKEW